MRKKLVLVLLLATMFAGGAFAQSKYLSVGFGGTFTADFITYDWTREGENYLNSNKLAGGELNRNLIGPGFFTYFDVVYLMLSLGMDYYYMIPANSDTKKAMHGMSMSFTTFDITVLSKYPFSVGAVTLFPMLGMDIKLAIAQETRVGSLYTYKGPLASGNYSSFWYKLGIGADIPLGDKLYLRPMFLYGIGLGFTGDDLPNIEIVDGKYTKMANIIFHGLDIKLAVGFKF
jgi:hypothetical protein